MTYIKWKDEVESYLGELPQAEKQKVFSYFSEMYADKRDAGKSEEQIIEEFGAPYDVAKRILADNKENSAQESGKRADGGNSYNYNYNYNYNYGGAPAYGESPYGTEQPSYAPPLREEPLPEMEMPEGTPREKKKKGAGHVIGCIILCLLILWLTVVLIGAPLTAICGGFVNIGGTVGALVGGGMSGAEATMYIGYAVLECGAGFILLAPFSAITAAMWKSFKKFA